RMLAEALGSGLGLVGGWLDCGRSVARRIGAQVVDPLARLAGLGPAPHAPTGDPPPADQPGGGEAAPQFQAEEAKYYLGPPRTPAARYADRESGELPRAYGCDRIVLLPRDPWWVFTYWEITPTTRVQALRAIGAEAEGARELLRVYDVTFITFTGDNAWQSFDVELPPSADRWYLNVGRPAASFCVEIGLATPGGRFLPLARSNVVTTPRATPSPDTAVRWVEIAAEAVRESDRVPTRLTLSLSPPLLAMLADHLLRGRYLRHLDRLVELAEKEERRTRADERFHRVAEMYLARFCRARTIFLEDWGQDLIAAFRSYQERGLLEIITCAATHGFLPLLAVTPGAVRAQIEVAVAEHRRFFARTPEGFWLPECAYEPGLDAELARAGVRYFFVDTHGI